MQASVFTCPSLHLRVCRTREGALECQGEYEGAAIKSVVPIDGDCIIMLDPDASKARVFRNLLRIDGDGHLTWRAELPADPDVFVEVQAEQGGLTARTWSGFTLHLDPATGRSLRQEFVK